MTNASTLPRYSYEDLPSLIGLMTGDEKHDLASLSTVDVIWVLYDRVLRVSPRTADSDSRDRFYLSKGHGPMVYYAVLTAKGFINADELPRYGQIVSARAFRCRSVRLPKKKGRGPVRIRGLARWALKGLNLRLPPCEVGTLPLS